MTPVTRRKFLGGALLTGGALTSTLVLPEAPAEESILATATDPGAAIGDDPAAVTPIDFRYSPAFRQTAYCFPDDPYKSVMNEKGTLLYGYDREKQVDYFPLIVNFAFGGMKPAGFVEQTLESPSVPIVSTTLQRDDATMLLTTFATRNPGEGRVDNVLIEIRRRGAASLHVSPIVEIHSKDDFAANM
ncbi:MAG TPA: twin-arginine translocation signal domain-containing protein, partial [Acidobacteriaceae bacterium]|nr:twin-arginine translocation signal domain-containing protein [Acidobacteriaceae bacterium]